MSRANSRSEKGKGKERELECRAPIPSTSTSRTLLPLASISSTKPSQRPSQSTRKVPIFDPGAGFRLDRATPPTSVRSVVTRAAPLAPHEVATGTQQSKAKNSSNRKVWTSSLAPISTFIPSQTQAIPLTVDPGPSNSSPRPPSPSEPDLNPHESLPSLLSRAQSTPRSKRRRLWPTTVDPSSDIAPSPNWLNSLSPLPSATLASPTDQLLYDSPPSNGTTPSHETSSIYPSPPSRTPTGPVFATPKRPRPNKEPEPDWSQCDPRLLPSVLFRSEFLIYGNPDYKQSYKNPFKPKLRANVGSNATAQRLVAETSKSKPSWYTANHTLAKNLAGRLLTDDEFLATVWARDVVGIQTDDGENRPYENGMRVEWLDGMKVYLLGKEFPCLKVLVMGYIVGVDVKEDEVTKESRVTYYVDDSTAVVRCTCTLPAPTRSFIQTLFIPQVYSEEGGTSKVTKAKSNLEPAEVEPPPIIFGVGSLVEVVGRVTEGSFAWQENFVSADKIEALRDATLEADHHVLVARLHRTVYDVPLDLEALLAKSDELETAEKERSWETASIATSEAGSPRKKEKRFKLANPNDLDPARLTASTFITYVNNYLRNHRLGGPSSQSAHPSSQPSSCGMPWSNNSVKTEGDLPRPFSIDDLARNKRLKRFAQLMAQRNEVVRRQKKKAKVTPFDPKVWIAKPESELKRRSSGASRMKGSASSAGSNSRVGVGDGWAPLDEDELAIATQRIFINAIRTMRKNGTITISDPEKSSSPNKLPQINISPVSTRIRIDDRNAHSRGLSGGGSPRKSFSPWSPWGDMGDEKELTNKSLDTPKVMRKSASKMMAGEEIQVGPWRISDASDYEQRADVESDRELTPRAHFRPVAKVPAPKQPIRHLGDIFSPTSAANPIMSTSMVESTKESFQLVTVSSLEPHLLRILEDARLEHSWKGLTAEAIRKNLAMDPRWEAVAVFSPLVNSALEVLEAKGLIRRKGYLFSALHSGS